MSELYPKYSSISQPSGKAVNSRVFSTGSLYGHFCKIHRILSVLVQILYVISLFGGFGN